MAKLVLSVFTMLLSWSAAVAAPVNEHRFANIDGGWHDLADWVKRPILVVNTASQCGFTQQYAELQRLQDTYEARGLVVLAVPSDDFNQELATAEAVKEFCELTFGLDLPMTDITPITGRNAHLFYRAVRAQTGFAPKWNFNKVLIAPNGEVLKTWGASTRPMSSSITRAIEASLTR